MPRLRFTRDERGYENTFLIHTARRRGRERTRILYWFRSPPQVKVGRAAFDEEAIRALEETHPEITFEWATILEARPPEPAPPDGERFRRGRGVRPRQGRNDSPPLAAPPEDLPPPGLQGGVERPETPAPSHPTGVALPLEESDAGVGAEVGGDLRSYGPSAAEQALGPEGLSRVRARYAEVLARISNRVTDAASADKLRELAEGLNPDAWVTAEEVTSGLEHFERVLERIRQELGQYRVDRRSRARTDLEGRTRAPLSLEPADVPAPPERPTRS